MSRNSLNLFVNKYLVVIKNILMILSTFSVSVFKMNNFFFNEKIFFLL